MPRKTKFLWTSLLSVLFALGAGRSAAQAPEMRAWFIDVGQGACTLLEFPCGAILIDTGGDGEEHVGSLIDDLNSFFERRKDLKRTLDSVIISHPHIDHTRGLQKVVENFTVKRYIDDGQTGTKDLGGMNTRWVRKQVALRERDILIREIRDDAFATGRTEGLTDDDIDPLVCSKCDPKITILAGGLQTRPANWSDSAFENMNNHSLVVRVDFGKASFLFTGDLENAGIARVLKHYEGSPLLDVDVYLVGHHGAENATTKDFLRAITPEIAVIGTGKWSDGKVPFQRFSTYSYGHPRAKVIELLAEAIPGQREPSVKKKVAEGVGVFRDVEISKKVYATGWDGTILITATLAGEYSIVTGKAHP